MSLRNGHQVDQVDAAPQLGPAEAFTIASERFLAQLRTELLNTRDAVREKGDHIGPVKAGGRPTTVANTLKGWAIHESTGAAPAMIYLRDGHDASGAMIAPISLNANESDREYFGERGLSLLYGLYIDVVSGAVEGAVYLGSS